MVLTNIMAESESKMIVDCVNVNNAIPWKIINEVKEREWIAISNTLVVQCYIESNKVADRLAYISYTMKQSQLFHDIKDLTKRIRVLINVGK